MKKLFSPYLLAREIAYYVIPPAGKTATGAYACLCLFNDYSTTR